MILKYYHYKKYTSALLFGSIAALAGICHFIVAYNIFVSGEFRSYFNTTYFIALGTGIPYALSLIYSNAGNKPWLKKLGVFALVLGTTLLSTFIWIINSQDVQFNTVLLEIHRWISLVGSLLLVFYIMNFLSELRSLKVEGINPTRQKFLSGFLGLIAIIALSATLFFGQKIANDSYWSLNWLNKKTERIQRLDGLFEARTYVSSQGDTLGYRLLKPLNYDSTKKYPLAVCLHSGGANGSDNVMQLEGAQPAQLLSQTANRRRYSAFIFVPQCSPGFNWGGNPNVPGADSLVFESIKALEKEFNIDPKRRYVLGSSMGGNGSWHFITSRPSMFAAAVPMMGGGDPGLAHKITDVPVWAFHGRKDRIVPVSQSREMIEAIKKPGGDPIYTEFPDATHNVWYRVTEIPGFLDWLFAQKRD